MVGKVLLHRYRTTEVDRYYVTEVDSVKELAAEGDRWKTIVEVGVEEKIKRIAAGDR